MQMTSLSLHFCAVGVANCTSSRLDILLVFARGFPAVGKMMCKSVKALFLLILLCGSLATACAVRAARVVADRTAKLPHAVLVVHGGAGVEKGLTVRQQEEYRQVLSAALLRGYAVFKRSGSSLAMVEAAVRYLEDSPLFNAGRGAVLTRDGKIELDAAIMDGRGRAAGAVAGVTVVKNPISLAMAVMRRSPHVMLIGEGANQFGREQGVEIVDQKYFWTQTRQNELDKMLEQEKLNKQSNRSGFAAHKYGTVGAVALDGSGNLAAGTSTGGLTGKRWGRVGDSAIIGSGTYADNKSCAVSCTGQGEWFIRFTAAADVAARYRWQKVPLRDAADTVIHKVLGSGHGEGGLIALDRHGVFAMPFNTAGMFRGYICADGKPHTFVYDK